MISFTPRRFRWSALLACCSMFAALPGAAELNCPSLKLATAHHNPPARHARGLLWRIVKPGLAPSYLFGTIHLGDDDVVTLPTPVSEAFTQSRRLVIEAKLDDVDLLQWSQTLLFGEGTPLRDRLGSELFQRTVALLSRYGIPGEAAAIMKPWAVYLTLMTPPATGGIPLDLALAMRAAETGKAVAGLETLEEQANVLAELPSDDQVALVTDVVCHYDVLQADIQAMKRLYLSRDLAGLVAAAMRYELSETPRYQYLLQQVLWDRNQRMVQRMGPYLSEGQAFVAVGALHLPGERGILGLLEKAGYSLESVY